MRPSIKDSKESRNERKYVLPRRGFVITKGCVVQPDYRSGTKDFHTIYDANMMRIKT